MMNAGSIEWQGLINWISAAFDETRYEQYAQKSGYFRIDSSHSDYINALATVSFPLGLPNDIQKVIAFLFVDGFFDHNQIHTNNWHNNENFKYFAGHQKNALKLPLEEQELDQFRESLGSLSWWHLTRGDLQGT